MLSLRAGLRATAWIAFSAPPQIGKHHRHDSGNPLMRLPAAGCHVPVARRQRLGESAVPSGTHGRGRQLRRPYSRLVVNVCSPQSHL
jgi:hypothetical protein